MYILSTSIGFIEAVSKSNLKMNFPSTYFFWAGVIFYHLVMIFMCVICACLRFPFYSDYGVVYHYQASILLPLCNVSMTISLLIS